MTRSINESELLPQDCSFVCSVTLIQPCLCISGTVMQAQRFLPYALCSQPTGRDVRLCC
ncbi:rCG47416 [Rattus norvegicus]|uniref:RCG47416 n=1 Tax=Rattus norvegicus TaxID=10116 RepID=A6I0H8_RAT|nr:rCG47416 [Rattus norvegicus]